MRPCVQKLAPILAVSHNVTNKSYLVCAMREKYSFWVTLRPQSDRYCRGEAEVCILGFETTWSESQNVSHNATEQGKAEQCIFDFKTTWSEFQKPSHTATKRGEAELRILNFKTTWSEFQMPSQTAPAEA